MAGNLVEIFNSRSFTERARSYTSTATNNDGELTGLAGVLVYLWSDQKF